MIDLYYSHEEHIRYEVSEYWRDLRSNNKWKPHNHGRFTLTTADGNYILQFYQEAEYTPLMMNVYDKNWNSLFKINPHYFVVFGYVKNCMFNKAIAEMNNIEVEHALRKLN